MMSKGKWRKQKLIAFLAAASLRENTSRETTGRGGRPSGGSKSWGSKFLRQPFFIAPRRITTQIKHAHHTIFGRPLPPSRSLDNDAIDLKVFPKSESTRACLSSALRSHFLFSDLEPSGVKDVVDAMVQEEALAGMVIITQGESGANEDK